MSADEEKAKALLDAGMKAMREMRREEAEQAFRDAVPLSKSDERLHARALARLMYALASQGRAHEAGRPIAEAARDSITDCARMAAGFVQDAADHLDDVDVARSAAQVAIVCNDLGDYGTAKMLLEGALPAVKGALGEGDPEYALMLYNLADVRGALSGSYDEVVPILRQAIAIQDAALAPGHFEKVAPLGTLGIILGRQGEYAEGRRALGRALEIALEIEGPDGKTPGLVRAALAKLEERAEKGS
ncbi:MAG: MalT-like region [Burkholderiales bacterium]|nr:MalT-like region [Burkholderiales bacterium]